MDKSRCELATMCPPFACLYIPLGKKGIPLVYVHIAQKLEFMKNRFLFDAVFGIDAKGGTCFFFRYARDSWFA